MPVKKGDHIQVDYEGRLEDGTVFDSSTHGDHSHFLEFEAGSGQVIAGFDEAVIGMEEGQEKEFTVPAKEAYGDYDESMKQSVPRMALPKDQEPKVGMVLIIGTPEGHQMPLRILAVDEDNVTLDMNHPLAGKNLIFKIKIIGINDTIKKDTHAH